MILIGAFGSCRRTVLAVAVAAVLGLVAPASQATLGAASATIAEDQARLKGVRMQPLAVNGAATTHSIALSDGSSIREYVTPAGIVFAVAWSTRFKPDLGALLGAHAATYDAAAREAMRTPGIRRNVTLQRGDLVVESAAHLNTFVGKAYLRSLVPEGFHVEDIR